MRRYGFYILIGIMAFGVGLFVFKFYQRAAPHKLSPVEIQNLINRGIEAVESINGGFDELSNANDGDIITVQGMIDEKFLCLDVSALQPNICTTVLIGNSSESKSLLIRLRVCNEQITFNCIAWTSNNKCSTETSCSEKQTVFDKDSKAFDTSSSFPSYEMLNGKRTKIYLPKPFNTQLKVTRKVTKANGKSY